MPQDIVITPNRGSTTSGAQIAFTGYSGATSIYLKVLPDSSLSFEGSAGQLFSITDNLSSGTIFSVNDITGIPSFDVNANGLVRLAPYAGNVALGTTATSGRLQINTGTATTIGEIIQGASGQSSNFTEWRNVSGTVYARVNASGEFFGLLASGIVTSGVIASGGIGVAGSSGQIQFNAGGLLGASAAVTYSSGGPHLNVTQQAYNITPMRVTVNSGSTANILEVYASGGFAGGFGADGTMYCSYNAGAGTNTLINAGIPDTTMQRSVIIGRSAYSSSGQIGELVAIGYSAGAGRYGVAVGQGTSAAANSIALGLNASASNANVSIAIGQYSNAAYANSCGLGSRATPAAAGDLVWATETQNPTIRTQRFDASINISYLFAGASTWIDSTAATKTSRFTLSTYYTTSTQEAIRIDSNADQARVGIGGAVQSGTTRLIVYTGKAAEKGFVVQGFTSQTANLQEWQNSAGSAIAYVNASGSFGGRLMSGTINDAYNFSATGLASGKTLSTDGTGVLSWATGGGGGPTISDDTSTNATRYVNFAAATTGTLSTIYTSSTKLTFNPSTGDFTAGGNITANSDIKIKKDIKTIENALEKVKSLRGVSFTRIGTDIKNVGVIAQEVEAVVPELVRESDGLKSVAYGNITALLIEAIKEQSKKIEELENKLCQLTSSQS